MDSARTIKRLGAKSVTVIYRRSEKQMPAEIKEIEDAKKDGVEFLFQNNIVKILGKTNVEKIECIKTELIKKEGEIREVPINIKNSNYEIDMDYVVMAIGSQPQREIIEEFRLMQDKNGYIKVNDKFQTSRDRIYAGGDIIGSRATIAWAAYAGRCASESIAKEFINRF